MTFCMQRMPKSMPCDDRMHQQMPAGCNAVIAPDFTTAFVTPVLSILSILSLRLILGLVLISERRALLPIL